MKGRRQVYWREPDPVKRAELKEQFIRRVDRVQRRNNNLRREGETYIARHFAHPFFDEPSERWARAAAQTDARPVNPLYFHFEIDANDKLFIVVVETGTRYPVPDDSPRLMRALIHHLNTTTRKC